MPEGGSGSRRDARCSPGLEASRGEQWAPRLDALCSLMTGSLAPALCSWQGRWDAGCIHDRSGWRGCCWRAEPLLVPTQLLPWCALGSPLLASCFPCRLGWEIVQTKG